MHRRTRFMLPLVPIASLALNWASVSHASSAHGNAEGHDAVASHGSASQVGHADADPGGFDDPAAKALRALENGNERHVMARYGRPNQTFKRREEIAEAQDPMAIIVSCSDSRVPPEIVFDRGLGDLFVVRTAGHVVDDVVLGSIEYAAEHLHVPLLVVLGHERCGAVAATIKGEEVPGHIGSLVHAIAPAIVVAKTASDPLDASVRANVKSVVEQLRASEPILAGLVARGELRVIGARYDLDTGAVEFFPEEEIARR